MTYPIKAFRRFSRNFLRDEHGTVMGEGLVMMPMLVWGYLSMFVFWDAYRTMNAVQKASYVVSDMISRELSVTPVYLTGLDNVMEYLLGTTEDSSMRVTSIVWDAADNRFEVLWSRNVSGGMTALTTGSLQTLAPRLPAMSDGDTVVLVETSVLYSTAMNVGIDDVAFSEFIVTRPRFANRIELRS